jgi:hypothetical protein
MPGPSGPRFAAGPVPGRRRVRSSVRSRYSAPITSTITTITATAPTNQSRNVNASASERSGLGGPFTEGATATEAYNT